MFSLCRAQDSGFELALLYEPSGQLQHPPALRQLELQLLQRRLHGAVHLQVGWKVAAAPGGPVSQAAAAATALEPGSLQAVLLAAADGEWPLLAAAQGAAQTAEQQQQQQRTSQQQQQQQRTSQQQQQQRTSRQADDQQPDDQSISAAAIDAAIAAPARLRLRLVAAAGPLAAAEPDFVLVRRGLWWWA